MPRHLLDKPILAALVAALALGACKKDEITHFRVPKPKAPQATSAPAMPAGLDANAGGGGMGGAMAGDVPPPAAPTGDQALAWTLPSGWTERRGGGGMRFATLVPPNAGVDVSVIVLPGPAGGELANVNRWRNQIGLPPFDDAALAAARKTTGSPAGSIAVFDFTSEDASKKRVVGGIAEASGNSWFFKLSGDAAAVEAAKPDFLRLLGSLRR